MTREEKHLLLTTARVLRAQFLNAAEPLEERDLADYQSLAAALAPFDGDITADVAPGDTGPEERRLLLATAQAVRGQLAQSPQAWEGPAPSPARMMGRAFAAATPPYPDDMLRFMDRD